MKRMRIFLLQMKALVKLSFVELWRRNDIFGLLVLGIALMVPLSMASPFGASGASRYLDEMALLLIWGFSLFVALGTGSRLFPPEFDSRTILPLLSKPISRGRLLFGKYLGAVTASWSALLFFYALFVGSMIAHGGGFSVELVQAVVFHMAFVAVAVALALAGSLLVTPSANLTLCAVALAGMFFFGRRLPEYAKEVNGVLASVCRFVYAVGPHAEFFDMRQRLVHGWGGVEWTVVAAVLAYGAVYAGACLGFAALVLRKRRA
ncbi:MAG: ABC transporter permease subunit [Kiritimatiellae bacterium]|nr:ABC transporter permease subunit [Kiritimatiellia bacterium]